MRIHLYAALFCALAGSLMLASVSHADKPKFTLKGNNSGISGVVQSQQVQPKQPPRQAPKPPSGGSSGSPMLQFAPEFKLMERKHSPSIGFVPGLLGGNGGITKVDPTKVPGLLGETPRIDVTRVPGLLGGPTRVDPTKVPGLLGGTTKIDPTKIPGLLGGKAKIDPTKIPGLIPVKPHIDPSKVPNLLGGKKIPICPPYPINPGPFPPCGPCPPVYGNWCWYPGFGNCYGWYGGCAVPVVVHETIIVQMPAPEVIDQGNLPQLVPGTTVEVTALNLGTSPGQVMLEIGTIALPCQVNAWADDKITLTVPVMGLKAETPARMVVLRADGQVARTIDLELVAATVTQK